MKMKNNIWAGLAFVLGLVLNPSFGTAVGVTSYPGINAASVGDLTALAPQAQEILWEHDIIRAAAQTSPFSDNMVGKPGSGKPIIIKNDTSKVAGQSIVIPTVDRLGARVVQGNGTRVGNEEKLKPGDFLLQIGLGWFGVGMDNVAVAQSVLGRDWEDLSKELLSDRLQKKQSDDNLVTLAASATAANQENFIKAINQQRTDYLTAQKEQRADYINSVTEDRVELRRLAAAIEQLASKIK